MNLSNPQVDVLRLMVRGAYDLQHLRIQTGLRLCANFRSKLQKPGPEPVEGEYDTPTGLSEEAESILDTLRASYKRLTDGVARNRTLPAAKGFEGDEIISSHTELTLVDQYIRIETQEQVQFRQMVSILDTIPIYSDYLKMVTGIGPAMAGVIISYLDPHKARHISSFWKYAGLDVGPDGMGRSRRAEHLVERVYINKDGEEATRLGLTYSPFLKTKLMGVVGPSFLRSRSPWRVEYDNYKHRIESDPKREKVTSAEWKKRFRAEAERDMAAMTHLWTPGRIHTASTRYMVKMFLADLWVTWRKLEGLTVTEPYAVAILGMRPHGSDDPPSPPFPPSTPPSTSAAPFAY